jgi:hypothetical protein
MFKTKILSFIFMFLLVLGFLNLAVADTVDVSGDWQGSWTSDFGGSGGVSIHIIQNGTSLSGHLTVTNTDCGTFSNISLTGSISGNVFTIGAFATCSLDGSTISLQYTNGQVNGNAMSGNYYVYSNGEFYDSGTFELTGELTGETYTITASAGQGGSITPSGTVSVNSGSNQAFNIVPDSGYEVSDVKVDGSSVGAVNSYTFSNISSNHTITATFTLVPQAHAMPWMPLLLLDH